MVKIENGRNYVTRRLEKESKKRSNEAEVAKLWLKDIELYNRLRKRELILPSFSPVGEDWIKDMARGKVGEHSFDIQAYQIGNSEERPNRHEWQTFYLAYLAYTLADICNRFPQLLEESPFIKKEAPLFVLFVNTDIVKDLLGPDYNGWVLSGPVMIVNVDKAMQLNTPRKLLAHLAHEVGWHLLLQLQPRTVDKFLNGVHIGGQKLSLIEADIVSERLREDNSRLAVSLRKRMFPSDSSDMIQLVAEQVSEEGLNCIRKYWKSLEKSDPEVKYFTLINMLKEMFRVDYHAANYFLFPILLDEFVKRRDPEGVNGFISWLFSSDSSSLDQYKPTKEGNEALSIEEYYGSLSLRDVKEIMETIISKFNLLKKSYIVLDNLDSAFIDLMVRVMEEDRGYNPFFTLLLLLRRRGLNLPTDLDLSRRERDDQKIVEEYSWRLFSSLLKKLLLESRSIER